jgi:hypothetical protein
MTPGSPAFRSVLVLINDMFNERIGLTAMIVCARVCTIRFLQFKSSTFITGSLNQWGCGCDFMYGNVFIVIGVVELDSSDTRLDAERRSHHHVCDFGFCV